MNVPIENQYRITRYEYLFFNPVVPVVVSEGPGILEKSDCQSRLPEALAHVPRGPLRPWAL